MYAKYLRGFTYYKMSNLDHRIANADQLLTQDVEKLSESVGELYSNLSKVSALFFPHHLCVIIFSLLQPMLDIVIYATKLSSAIGVQVYLKLSLELFCSEVFCNIGTSLDVGIPGLFWSPFDKVQYLFSLHARHL
jgi:ATP-binding cassette subfamily D (ALD) protein 3